MWSTRDGQPPIYALKADFFRALGHPARVRMLQLLREDERSVGALRDALGLDASSTSQHLAALRAQGLVVSRKQGTSVYYRVRDPRTLELLELAKQIISGHARTTRRCWTTSPSRTSHHRRTAARGDPLAWAALAGVATLACGSVLAAADPCAPASCPGGRDAALGGAGVAVLAGGQRSAHPFRST